MSDVSPFRLFGRPPGAEPAVGAVDDGVTWAPGSWHGEPTPATRHARPVPFARGGSGAHAGNTDGPGPGRGRHSADDDAAPAGGADDTPTDPHGFPPIPDPYAAAWGLPASSTDSVRSAPAPDPVEAAALAGAFAADYLSWDEDDPGRRGRALAEHLPPASGDPGLLGWDGHGRQRAEFALPGSVRPDGDDRVLVDVRARVTPYRKVDRAPDHAVDLGGAGGAAAARSARGVGVADAEPEVLGVAAAAPAPTAPGWCGCASYWVRLSVPVVRDGDRLVVDAADETEPDLDPGPAPRTSTGPRPEVPRAAPNRAAALPEPESAW